MDKAELRKGHVKALIEAYWKLRSYAVHDDDCTRNKPPRFRNCSCGLTNAALEAQVGALRLQLDQKDALYDSGFQAGVKLGWNFGVSGDEAGFQAATSSTEHVAELKRIRAALAEVQADARREGA
jgi:hypothetical protein